MFSVSTAWFDALIAGFWWPLVRILAVFAAEPFFSSRSIPRTVKLLLGLAITFVVMPVLPPMPQVEPFSAIGIFITLNQILIGLAIGFTMRIAFTALEMAGHLSGLQMGLGFASFFDPQHNQQLPILAVFASLFGVLLYLTFDAHLMMISTLVQSFYALPITANPLGAKGFGELFHMGGLIFAYGLWLAMPVVAVLLVANLGIGVMARAAPQINLFAVGFPITLALGMAAFYVTMPQMGHQFMILIELMLQEVNKVLDLLIFANKH